MTRPTKSVKRFSAGAVKSVRGGLKVQTKIKAGLTIKQKVTEN